MATNPAPRLPANKLSQAVREHVHYPSPEAAESALIAILADGTCRATAHAQVGYFAESGKLLDFSVILSAIRPVELVNLHEFEDNAVDPGGKRKGFRVRRRRDIAIDLAVEAQGDVNTSPRDPSRRSGGGGSKGKGPRNLTQKNTNTVAMNGPKGMGNT